MRSRAWLFVVLFLLVSTPLAMASEALLPLTPSPVEGEGLDVLIEPPLTEQERLKLASEHWHLLPEAQQVLVDLKRSTGLIHLAAGSFDPLIGDGPEVGHEWMRKNDASFTGMAILQLEEANGLLLNQLSENHNFAVLDVLHDEAWLIRLDGATTSFDALEAEEGVRWVGHQQPGWRVEPSLLQQPSGTPVFNIVPTSDLALGGYGTLATDIVRFGASEATCDAWMCSAAVEPQHARTLLHHLAHDGRVLWMEPAFELRVHNTLAWSIAGVQNVANNATFTLDGSGEMIAIADTGLDQNHPDLTGRVAATYTQFGLDPSPADSNSGHGTHIAVTVLGNGTGDADARGVAPAATLVMYALEHDPTGVFGRIGSIYDMLRDAEQMTARLSVNAWGLNGNYGQYTADARSVDIFVHDRKDLTPVFSVGDNGGLGASQVTSPATAKNVIAIGASITGVGGPNTADWIANFSSLGPSLDGRVKPDLVAPGVGICSGLAEEARNPAGSACLSGNHQSGNAYYMSLSGTSQATAVASGVAALTREFIREQAGIGSPSSALVKAALINGAKDLGAPDIPNDAEGWGQIDLERTVLPMDGSTALDNFFDDKKSLSPGFGLLYSFSLDPIHGADITLAWTDEAGSANAPQSESRLVNDLDLVLVAPDGTEWLGNQFAQGFSAAGGTADDVNNVERIRIAPGALSGSSGTWIVKVLHRGGSDQDFALVVTASASPTPQPDLMVFDGSILTSSENPLKDDLISIRLAWVNQGTSSSPGFDIRLEDTTTQTTLATSSRPSLEPGMIDSLTIFHQFSTTGIHTLRLSVDTGDAVVEMNDASNGVDNNVLVQDIEVMALGVRVVVENEDGSLPATSEERSNNAQMTLDVRNDSGITIPLSILHEGTGNQSVLVSATTVQIPAPGREDFFLPSGDLWTRTFNETPNFILEAQGTEGANKSIELRLEDIDADLTSDPNNPRYVRAGTYVVEVTARYEYQPTVAHTQRIKIVVEQIDQVDVVSAGTSGLEAEPGASSSFSISVRNTGNAPAQYSVECQSAQRWQLMLGGSNSSQLDFEPLNILEYLPMSIRIIVPLVADGVPSAGDIDTITCYVTSSTDPTMNYTESVTMTVLAQESFDVHLMDDDGRVGPNQLSPDISVDSGQQVHLNLSIVNTGNIAVDLDVSVLPDNPQWALEVSYDGQSDSRNIAISLGPGEEKLVKLLFAVPVTAVEGDSNEFTIRTERSLSNFRQNITKLIVRDELGIQLTPPEGNQVTAAIADGFSYGEFTVKNTGNTDLFLEWTHGLAPDGWSVGFANPSTYLEPREEKIVRFGLVPPPQTPATENAFEILIGVNASNQGRFVEASEMINVAVMDSVFANITTQQDGARLLLGLDRSQGKSETLVIRNDGNMPLSADLSTVLLDKNDMERTDWTITLTPSSISDLGVGEESEVVVNLVPKENVVRGVGVLHVNLSDEQGLITSLELEVSVSTAEGSTGLFSILPPEVSIGLVMVLLVGTLVVGRRMKKSGELHDDGTELVAPNTHTDPDLLGARRDSALDLGSAVDELTSGEVSDEEIAKAIMQSMDMPVVPAAVPSGLPPAGLPPKRESPVGNLPAGLPPAGLPPTAVKSVPSLPQVTPTPATPAAPPLPPGGLPAGWTMEQWQHYGHEWLRRHG
ncbi:MAG: hypothetical protein DWC10_08095 [Candidatus Poseidoniales archaeon]|nr:MAG: hypothetical protein DWC10_08095 [Candidatus Poseidoniales archaeon]